MFELFVVGNVIEIFLGEEEALVSGAREGPRHRVRDGVVFMSTLTTGVYKIEIRLEGNIDPNEYDIDEWSLVLPTGNLAALTSALTRLGTVKPGSYRAQVGWSSLREGMHMCLERLSDYPPGDGPDGLVILTWLGPCEPTE